MYLIRSEMVVTFSLFSESPENAWTVIGTFWTLSLRRVDVTMTSWTPALGVSVSAANAAPPLPHRIAATAQEIFNCAFTYLSPEGTDKTVQAHSRSNQELLRTRLIQSIPTDYRDVLRRRGRTIGAPDDASVTGWIQVCELISAQRCLCGADVIRGH